MTDRWKDYSPKYLLPPYLLHNYWLRLRRETAGGWKAGEGGRGGGAGGGRGRVTSGHIPPPQPPAQAGPASTAACDTRELHKVREENLQNDSIFIQCLISLT